MFPCVHCQWSPRATNRTVVAALTLRHRPNIRRYLPDIGAIWKTTPHYPSISVMTWRCPCEWSANRTDNAPTWYKTKKNAPFDRCVDTQETSRLSSGPCSVSQKKWSYLRVILQMSSLCPGDHWRPPPTISINQLVAAIVVDCRPLNDWIEVVSKSRAQCDHSINKTAPCVIPQTIVWSLLLKSLTSGPGHNTGSFCYWLHFKENAFN